MVPSDLIDLSPLSVSSWIEPLLLLRCLDLLKIRVIIFLMDDLGMITVLLLVTGPAGESGGTLDMIIDLSALLDGAAVYVDVDADVIWIL